MVASTASTRQPPAGGSQATIELGGLLTELRAGDGDAFVRYFRLFRAPVHHFTWLLLGDGSAAAATEEALVGAFRRAVLDDAGDDLEVLTYACALEACEARAGVRRNAQDAPERRDEAVAAVVPRRRRHARGGDLRQRYEAALEALDPRKRAALLLHDVAGLEAARSAVVLGVSADAAAALLFRAREEFRAVLPAPETDGVCRQAEEATTGAVGRGLHADELSRLRHHAAYCRSCRRTLKEWAGEGAGLTLVLAQPPLPQALAETPVFGGDVVETPASPGVVAALAARAGRVVRGRAAAWVVTAACVAVAAGVIAHGVGVRPLVVRSVGPAIRLITTPNDGAAPAQARSAGQSTRSAAGAIGISGTTPVSAPAAQPPAPAGSGGEGAGDGGTGAGSGGGTAGPSTDDAVGQDTSGQDAAGEDVTGGGASPDAAGSDSDAGEKDASVAGKHGRAHDAHGRARDAHGRAHERRPDARSHDSHHASSQDGHSAARLGRPSAQHGHSSSHAGGSHGHSRDHERAHGPRKDD